MVPRTDGLRLMRFTAVAAAVSLAGGLTMASSTAARPAAPPAQCARSFDPYRTDAPVLRSCGDKILPLRSVTSLPGGGQAYSYGAFTQLVPPAHFSPLTASDRELREYGFPTRRQLGARWASLMSHYRGTARPTPFLVQAPAAHRPRANTSGTSLNWSGNVVTGHDYLGVSAQWFEPSFTSSPCTKPGAFGQWVGLGGASALPYLGQDGTSFNYPTLGAHQAFVQVLPNDNGPVPVALYATPGQVFYAQVFWNPSNTWYDYFMENAETGKTAMFHSATAAAHDGSTAEVITERPFFPDGTLANLSNYQHFQVQDSTGYWGNPPTSSAGFNNLPDQSISMMHSGHTMSSPGSFMGSNFNMFWSACD
jgi:hypothetical protein